MSSVIKFRSGFGLPCSWQVQCAVCANDHLCDTKSNPFCAISKHLLVKWDWNFINLIWNANSLNSRSPFYLHGLTLIPSWKSNYIHYKVWDEIICLLPNFNGFTVDVSERTSYFIPHFIGHMNIIHAGIKVKKDSEGSLFCCVRDRNETTTSTHCYLLSFHYQIPITHSCCCKISHTNRQSKRGFNKNMKTDMTSLLLSDLWSIFNNRK